MKLLRLLGTRPESRIEHLPDGGAILHTLRAGRVTDSKRLGTNHVHAMVIHPDGDVTDCGVSENFLTTVGRTLAHEANGQRPIKAGVLTASSATSATPSGGGMTADAYKGWRIYCPITSVGTKPVYGNIGSNNTTVFTIDQWWDEADAAAGTPASTNGYMVVPTCIPRFMAVTADTGAGAVGDTTLTGEMTTNGLARALATFAYTGGTATETLQKQWSVSGGPQTIHRMGLFTAMNITAGGILVFETVLNSDAITNSGDTLQVTDTITISG